MGLVDKINRLMNPDADMEGYDDDDYAFDDGYTDGGFATGMQQNQAGYQQNNNNRNFHEVLLSITAVQNKLHYPLYHRKVLSSLIHPCL